MGKNKPCYNAFYFFMLEYKAKNSQCKSLKDAADAASPSWNALTAEQKKPYEKKAKEAKNKHKVGKYTSEGMKIDVVQKQQNEQINRVINMKSDIEHIIQLAVGGDLLAEEPFYIIHVNTFCYHNGSNSYIPAEIGICRFTLRNGVLADDVYHSFINTGSLPVGYKFSAEKQSKDTHQIPIPERENDRNVDKVTDEFFDFIMRKQDSVCPPIYTRDSFIPIVENVLKFLAQESGYDRQDFFRVFSLEYLFFKLRNAVSPDGTDVYPTVTLSATELDKDRFDYNKNMPCEFHKVSDVPNHCSRSVAVRWAYIICDNCCGDLEIALISGQHVPIDVKIEFPDESRFGDAESECSSVYSTTRRRNKTYFLSERTESPTRSEVSSLIDPSDYSTVGGYAELSQQWDEDDDEGFSLPVQHRRYTKKQLPPELSSQNSSVSTPFAMPDSSGAGTSSQVSSQTVRRPNKLSAGLIGDFSHLSLSKNMAQSIGKGRGRGIGTYKTN